MKRVLSGAVGLLTVVGVILIVQFLDREREYRRLLTDGDEALRAGDAYRAIEALSGAVTIRPESMVAYFRRAEAYRAQRRADEAVRDLRTASRLAPDATEPLVALGELAAERGDHALAAEWYSRAAERLQGEAPDLLYALALERYRAGTPAAAVDPLRRAIARRDPGGGAHFLLGLVYRDTNHPDEAIDILEEAIRIAPSLLPAREELADLYRAAGRADDEISQLAALTALDEQPGRRIALALAEARDGRFEAALATLDHIPSPGLDDSLAQLTRGRVHLVRDERTPNREAARLALASLERALGGSARRSEGLALFGRALHRSGDAAGAERILREAVATSPVDVEAYAYLADAAEELAHPIEARNALATLDALEGDTASRQTRAARARRLGALSLQANEPRRAVRYLRDAVDGGEDTAATFGLLADACRQSGDLEQAVVAIQRALTLAPNDRALQRLARAIHKRP
jgi:tetratricopeptide (TPR) repeat protein